VSWSTEQQRSDAARALLRSIGHGDLWTDRGPTGEACQLLEEDGGYLSSGGRVILRFAFDCWNGQGRIPADELLYSLDPRRLRLVGTLMVALAEGTVDRWLEANR